MGFRRRPPVGDPPLWIVQVSAEDGAKHFNVLVADEDRERAEATAEGVLRQDGWNDVRGVRSGQVSETGLADRDPVFNRAAAVAREFGFAVVRYKRDS